jgi:hypothetical protein
MQNVTISSQMENLDMITAKISHGHIAKLSKISLAISSDAVGHDIGGKSQEQNSKNFLAKCQQEGLQ